MDAQPVLLGRDVVALYPSLEPVAVAELTAKAVRESSIKFNGVNFYFLLIYLFITMGRSQMERLGMGELVPKYKRKEKNSQSLAATHNRN